MGQLLEIVTPLHQATQRDYLTRMQDEKVYCMKIAKRYEKDYWDGDRRYGYGGYKYIPGRWKPVVEELFKIYKLNNHSSVLDVGCGKAFLLYEMKLLLLGLKVAGFDLSKHGLAEGKEDFRESLFIHKAQEQYPFEDKEFDLVISLGCLHNLRIFELQTALSEMERVGKHGYIMLESYRNEQELFNLQCWALTCESFFDHEEWPRIYQHFGYSGDYEFIYSE
jgi:ubiquinone/menaquinone biosynthesis C-methylase UbiE